MHTVDILLLSCNRVQKGIGYKNNYGYRLKVYPVQNISWL